MRRRRRLQLTPAVALRRIVTAHRPPLPIRIKIERGLLARRRCVGDCRVVGRGPGRAYEVRVEAALGNDLRVEVVIHEAAHCYSWKGEDHGEAWGRWYSRCYRAALRVA